MEDSTGITVVFRNQARQPVTVIINGYSEANGTGTKTTLYSGVLTDKSGVYDVTGYQSYACSARADRMLTPLMRVDSTVTTVFEQYEETKP